MEGDGRDIAEADEGRLCYRFRGDDAGEQPDDDVGIAIRPSSPIAA